MSDTNWKQPSTSVPPVEMGDRIGDYFKTLFARSLRMNLDDGREPRSWAHSNAQDTVAGDAELEGTR